MNFQPKVDQPSKGLGIVRRASVEVSSNGQIDNVYCNVVDLYIVA